MLELEVAKKPGRNKSAGAPADPIAESPAPVADTGDEITTYKVYKRDAKLLSKIGAMLDMAQQDTIAHFRREFENLLLTLMAREQKRLQGGQG